MIENPFPFDIREVPCSMLAYIGDAVYELHVRLHVARAFPGHSGDLHRRSIGYVSAGAQARAMRRLLPHLTEQEAAIYRRARNHTASSLPKNADPVQYRIATGFEGLVGYLYLSGEHDRLQALLELVLNQEEI